MINLNRNKFQAYPNHICDESPWPLINSVSLLILTLSSVLAFHSFKYGKILLLIGLICVVSSMIFWFKDIVVESTYQGNHTSAVTKGITLGVFLFIISEVFFFLSIFWAFFHSSLNPVPELGSVWPPQGIETLNPFELPLLNTIILLSSGATITLAHHSFIKGDRKKTLLGFSLTIILALIFTACQGFEYWNAPYTITDSVFGSCFFFSTGFHGFHIIIGTLFLLVAFWRIINYNLTEHHHVNVESAILYWHFVDVVWLALYLSVYYWGI